MAPSLDPLHFFSPTSFARRDNPRVQTTRGNYIATFRAPTAVTHSCFGHFTGPKEENLIICKSSIVSIYLVKANVLEHLRDFPMFEKVVYMELSHLSLSKKYCLLVATEQNKLCVFEWNAEVSTVISIHTMKFRPEVREHTTGNDTYKFFDFLQGATVCPNGKNVVMYSRRNTLRIIDLDQKGKGTTRFVKMLNSTKILDAKFLRNRPELALLYKGADGNFTCGIHEITLDDLVSNIEFHPDPAMEPTLLIPSYFSVLVIGKNGVIYFDMEEIKTKSFGYFDIQAYERVDEQPQRCRYLLGGHDGSLSVIEIKKNSAFRLSGITMRPVGKSSIASSITYLRDETVFIGSRYADSQLLKMHQLHEPSNSTALQVLETFSNSGPVLDLSLSNKATGVRRLVMCCENSLEAVSNGVGIHEKFFFEAPDITRVWSLKYSVCDKNHKFLILDKTGEGTYVYTIDGDGEMRSHTMKDLVSNSVTVCCHEAGDREFIQVTEDSVRLIGSKTGLLQHKWHATSKIHFASATTKQVLLANANQLVYLEIIGGKLVEQKVQEGYQVSCLDISPIDANNLKSKLAAVGLWKEHSVRVFSLPELSVLTVVNVGSHVPRCILLCAFERVPYLLCALEDGTLWSFKINKNNGELSDKNIKELGGFGKTLRTFSSNGVSRVFLSTQVAPKLIFTKNGKMEYSWMNLSNIHDICPFQRDDISEGLAIIKEDGVVICQMGNIEKHARVPMVHCGRRICQQEQTHSNAIIVEEKKQGFTSHLVQLLDKEFNTLSFFRLNEGELGLTIISCSFPNDQNTYYCVGTGDATDQEGRILVFAVRDEELNLISQAPTNGAVYYLKALHGGLLVTVSATSIHYFDWEMHEGAHELVDNFSERPTGWEELFASFSSTMRKFGLNDTSANVEPKMRALITATQMLPNDSLFFANGLYNIYASKGFYKNLGVLPSQPVGGWHSGELVTQMAAGTISRLCDEEYAQAPSVVFSTESGAIGVIVSLPTHVYDFLKNMQELMWEKTKGIGYPDESSPRTCFAASWAKSTKEFLDGDLIESFPTLALEDQVYIAEGLEVDPRRLLVVVAYLKLFH